MNKLQENNHEEMDEVDGIRDVFKSATIKLVEFVQETMTNDTYQEIGKEFFKILNDVIKVVITGDLDIANNLDNLLIESKLLHAKSHFIYTTL